jgi:hypothetical protein
MKACVRVTQFLAKTLLKVPDGMPPSVLAYNLTQVVNNVRTKPLMITIVA